MKKIVFIVMAMVSMSNVNAEVTVPAEGKFTKVYNYDNEKVEYEMKNNEVVSKVVYKWNENLEAWKPLMKYAISKNADTTILSCGYWDENTKEFSSSISIKSFATADCIDVIALPTANDDK